jgi:hypothetical protein
MDDSSLDVRNISRCIKHQMYKTSQNEIYSGQTLLEMRAGMHLSIRLDTAVASAQNFITGYG